MSFREFCALVYIVAAQQSSQLVACLYDHGVLLFDILGGGQHFVSGERAKGLGRCLGFAEYEIDETAEEIGITSYSLVNFPDFQMLYYKIFSKM